MIVNTTKYVVQQHRFMHSSTVDVSFTITHSYKHFQKCIRNETFRHESNKVLNYQLEAMAELKVIAVEYSVLNVIQLHKHFEKLSSFTDTLTNIL